MPRQKLSVQGIETHMLVVTSGRLLGKLGPAHKKLGPTGYQVGPGRSGLVFLFAKTCQTRVSFEISKKI